MEQAVKHWWKDEIKLLKKYSNKHNHSIINILSYRILNMFFQSVIHCPFRTKSKKQNKQDRMDFFEENQKFSQNFLNLSIKTISNQKKFQSIVEVVPLLERYKKINIAESLHSSTHKLYGKDWDIAKGSLIGAVTGGVVSVFLGPVIGSYIGNLAGFSGAAATSYGLAFLGGGSLAAGGFGMAGGSAILGLGFGIATGVRGGVKGASKDTLNTMQAQVFSPTLLAIGRAQFEIGDTEIPWLIHKTIYKNWKESEKRLNTLEKEYDQILDDFSNNEKEIKNLEKSIKSVKLSVKLYKRATSMCEFYNWTSGYDIWQEIKSWAS